MMGRCETVRGKMILQIGLCDREYTVNPQYRASFLAP